MSVIPQMRIREKVDEYMSRRDYTAVERHLTYWLKEAEQLKDDRGRLMVLNELVGHYRKVGIRDKALECADRALQLIEPLELTGTYTEGTTCINAATALNAFSEFDRAETLFERARAIYETFPNIDLRLLGGLYNNMALNCASLNRFTDARTYYDKAMSAMSQVENGELELAMTCLNLANLVEARDGLAEGEGQIDDLLDRAADYIHRSSAPKDGYYAFVCEKCAPTFDYYGYFLEAEALRREAEAIYAGH